MWSCIVNQMGLTFRVRCNTEEEARGIAFACNSISDVAGTRILHNSSLLAGELELPSMTAKDFGDMVHAAKQSNAHLAS